MPTEMLTKTEHPAPPPSRPSPRRAEQDELRVAAQHYAKRVRRLKINVAAFAAGTILLTALWVLVEWSSNGAFERFAHEGNPGDWNPTLWGLVVGIWGLVVGIKALRVYFERPVTASEIDGAAASDDASRQFARRRIEGIRRLKFHVSAWVLGMIVITPLNALIEWQDNGGFERLSSNSRPGSWDPWVLYIGGIWALVIVALALFVYTDRPKTSQRHRYDWRRLRPSS